MEYKSKHGSRGRLVHGAYFLSVRIVSCLSESKGGVCVCVCVSCVPTSNNDSSSTLFRAFAESPPPTKPRYTDSCHWVSVTFRTASWIVTIRVGGARVIEDVSGEKIGTFSSEKMYLRGTRLDGRAEE